MSETNLFCKLGADEGGVVGGGAVATIGDGVLYIRQGHTTRCRNGGAVKLQVAEQQCGVVAVRGEV